MALRLNVVPETLDPPDPKQFFEAQFANEPAINEGGMLIIPSLSPTHVYGPCPWAPRFVNGSTYALPSKGDHALVLKSEDEAYWVVDWWPY